MQTVSLFVSNDGKQHSNKIDAIVSNIQFELQHNVSSFKRPFGPQYKSPVTIGQLGTTLSWLYENKDRPELKEFFKMLQLNETASCDSTIF